MNNFGIILDNPSQSYSAGELVSGRVVTNFNKDKKTTGLKLECTGICLVEWTQIQSHRKYSSYVAHKNEELYFGRTFQLVHQNDGQMVTIPSGHQEYPFSFQLPNDIPSTFQDKYGSVQYTIEATLKRTLKFNFNSKVSISVNGILDLNNFPAEANPSVFSEYKNISWCCGGGGEIGFLVKLNRTGYVPGDHLEFDAEFLNKSALSVHEWNIKIIRINTFRAVRDTKVSTETILKRKGQIIYPGEEKIFRGYDMQIPFIPPTNLGGCLIINVQYFLEIEMKLSCLFKPLKGKTLLIIGTIPFQSNSEQSTSTSSQEPECRLPQNIRAEIDEGPPPYEEVVKNDTIENQDPPPYLEFSNIGHFTEF